MKRRGIPNIKNTFIRRVLCPLVIVCLLILMVACWVIDIWQEVIRAIGNMSFSKGSKLSDVIDATKNCWNGNYDA